MSYVITALKVFSEIIQVQSINLIKTLPICYAITIIMPNVTLPVLSPCFIAFPKTMLAQVYLYSDPFEPKIVSAHGTRTLDGVICSYLHIGKCMVQE
jgi:hypothetical protein